jgi:hypothetical protein
MGRFKWQINASAVGKLLGFFGKFAQKKAIAENWNMNLKRMPRFGAVPSFVHQAPTADEVIIQEIEKEPVYAETLIAAVQRTVKPEAAIKKIKEKVVADNKRAAVEVIEIERNVKRMKRQRFLVNFTKKSRGIDTCCQKGYFSVGTKIYYKKSRRTAILSSLEDAKEEGWIQQQEIVKMEEKIVAKKVQVKKTERIVQNVDRIMTQTISTTRGIVRELTDLQKIKVLHPNLVAGNNSAKFMSVKGDGQYNGFVIGKCDGFDKVARTIFELKHRRSKLFHGIRKYEQIQCILYLKMHPKFDKLVLVETFLKDQLYYHMKIENEQLFWKKATDDQFQAGLRWEVVLNGLKSIVSLFNKAETSESYRQTLIDTLYNN